MTLALQPFESWWQEEEEDDKHKTRKSGPDINHHKKETGDPSLWGRSLQDAGSAKLTGANRLRAALREHQVSYELWTSIWADLGSAAKDYSLGVYSLDKVRNLPVWWWQMQGGQRQQEHYLLVTQWYLKRTISRPSVSVMLPSYRRSNNPILNFHVILFPK